MDSLNELEDIFDRYWKNAESCVVMPYSAYAATFVQKIAKDVKIEAVLDNNPKYVAVDGYADENDDNGNLTDVTRQNVRYAPEYLRTNDKKKILIFNHYDEIAKQLEAEGYVENVDYISMSTYVSVWYWKMRKQLCMQEVHIAITTYCTLNCKNCSMALNHYSAEARRTMTFDEFKENVNLFFEYTDYCDQVAILGGEPFLNKELGRMIEWFADTIPTDRYGSINITTNGTILPDEQVMDIIEKTHTEVLISDYSLNESYSAKLDELEQMLQKRHIAYMRRTMPWKELYSHDGRVKTEYPSVREHMLCCSPVCRGLNDKRFYYCHNVWSAVSAGLISDDEADYVNLAKEEGIKEAMLAHNLGFLTNGATSMCRHCGGFGSDNSVLVTTGEQE